jgi:3-dehydroquinate dehydratase/shikimate dehydrogenase
MPIFRRATRGLTITFMICVTIGRGRHSSLAAEWKAAAEAGARLVELRIDCLRRDPDLKRILTDRPTPIVFTIRRGADGGLWRGDEERRQKLLREAIVLGVDYVDIESDIAKTIPRPKFGTTKRIISHHDFKKIPEDLEERVDAMRQCDADIVKVAALASSVPEASRMLEIVAKSQTPTVSIAMGPLGYFTRIWGRRFGSPMTYAGFNPDRTFAPGQPQFHELVRDYFYDDINRETELYAVIGDPIAHSLSPAVHNAAFMRAGLNKRMLPIQIPEGKLADAFQALRWLDLKGISVTIPHKEDVLKQIDGFDKSVERIGACNTVVKQPDGRYIGHNTDYRAAIASLEAAMGGSIGEVSPLMDKQVLILGAGGVARTIASGLVRRGAGVTITARNDEKANHLAEELGCRATTWSMRAGTLCDVLINCTPVGMHPDVDSSPAPAAAFREGMLAFDTVYHPENTLFLKHAIAHGCAAVSGVDMFIAQAAMQFHFYTGQDAPEDAMRDAVRRKLGAVRE